MMKPLNIKNQDTAIGARLKTNDVDGVRTAGKCPTKCPNKTITAKKKRMEVSALICGRIDAPPNGATIEFDGISPPRQTRAALNLRGSVPQPVGARKPNSHSGELLY